MIKRLFFLLSIFCTLSVAAQQFNNEWIDYGKTYYKFKVGTTGLYRIPQSTLAAANLAGTDASYFQLWHNGQEVPIYTSSQSGVLASSGYIEFWGEANDGKPDMILYRNPNDQINNSKSLFTDTSSYYLTINSTGNNRRLVPTNNNIPAGVGAEPYFIHTVGIYPNESIHLGPYVGAVSEAAISASYETGEGWTSNEITENKSRTFSQTNLFPYTGSGAPQMQLKLNIVGNSPNNRTVNVLLNNSSVFNTSLSGFNYAKLSANVPVSGLTGAVENISVANVATTSNNRIKVGALEMTYPRVFNFGGASNFRFNLSANSSTGKYLEISGFNYSGIPILYDLSNGRRYEANVSTPTLVKVYVQPSTISSDFVLVNTVSANIKNVLSLETKNFIDYAAAANQGDYLMITHEAILNGANGAKPVEEYRAYRSSSAGGGYKAKVYMIDQLVDQFAFGIKQNPLAVRNFLRFARSRFSIAPKSAFIVGHGLKYVSARTNESSPITERLNLVPTFGTPPSDILLAAEGNSSVPLTPIGRVSVINGDELSLYLEKIKQYEQLLIPQPEAVANSWKKNIAHIVGADDPSLVDQLYGELNIGKSLVRDSFYGANVTDFLKNSNAGEQQRIGELLRSYFNNGVNLFSYFGHSSAEGLVFKLDEPSGYNNQGKYPVFHMMGCNVGDIFIWNQSRLTGHNTFSEKFLFAKERGSIAMMAGTSFGYVYPLQQYNREMYKLFAKDGYGLPIGEVMQKTIQNFYQIAGGETSLFHRTQAEEYTLNGDPAIRLYQFQKPDYAIEDNMLEITPAILSVADQKFTIDVKIFNLGKAIDKDLIVELKRTFPNSSTNVIRRDTISRVHNTGSISYQIPIDPITDKGSNKFTVSIDPENLVDELFESNNIVTKDIFIYEDNIKPVFPYDNSIINRQNIILSASTGNPFAESRQYIMEIDTTKLFNSSLKFSQTKTSIGGVIEFDPELTFKNETVYYWRVASVPANNDPPIWNNASFTFIQGTDVGFGQSHYYQIKDNILSDMLYNKAGSFTYDSVITTLTVNNRITNTAGTPNDALFVAYKLNKLYIQGGYIVNSSGSISPQENSLRFYLIKDKSLAPVENVDNGTSGLYDSYRPTPIRGTHPRIVKFFQFDISTAASRKTVMNFLDSIPNGYFVALTSNQTGSTILPSVWQGDTTIFGKNVSLYHKLKAVGLTEIDQINAVVPYIFIYQKGKTTPLAQAVATNTSEQLSVSVPLPAYGTSGTMKSPLFTKSKSWKKLEWDGFSVENPSTDNASISVSGINENGVETILLSDIPASQKSVDLSTINTEKYSGLIASLQTKDSIERTPYQLKYWRFYGDPAPEGAVAPNLYYSKIDTLEIGQNLNLGVAFKNISPYPFDSMSVKLSIRDKNNVETILPIPKAKPIVEGDTIRLNTSINTKSFPGSNTVFLEFNPIENYQAEQYSFNNFIAKNFYVRSDTTNPYLDVTFDGVHILNRDIVSSKPDIKIELTDDAKYLLLNNSDLIKVQLRHPDGSLRSYQFNSDTLRLIPPGQGGNNENTATVSFKPHLLEDGEYELIVSAKDQSGNSAGKVDYRIAFQVINKPMISNLLNYPNPFTTSTAFVFTLTGSEIPQNIRIQILTITGKIVREITKAELGPLRIGRNITEFKWDGTDQYGQKLANGVYLYRVLTNLNGKNLDKYKAPGDNTDRYFNKGYGKMVLIR